MELTSRKTSKRAIEPVDEWLQNEGYYRKHAPKDPTCLFRAVSEQVYQNQRCHIRVRKECVEYMKKNKHMFEEKISIPYDSYLDQMACFTEWGGMNEILAMSLLFKRNVIIFHGQKFTRETVIDHGFKDSLYLCFTPPKQYESVYTQEYTADAGFCQYLVYQTLYKNVFKMNNVDVTVHKMLHERSTNLRHDKFFLKGNLDIRNQLTLELFDKIEETEETEEMQLLSKGITPFPYRVAKALDPNIYRNVDYDIWHEIRREVRNSGYTKFNSTELQVGARCLVQKKMIDLKENDRANNNFLTSRENWDNNCKTVAKTDKFYTGHIQEMSKNDGPVVVFIQELGEKMSVPYDALKPFPQNKIKPNNWAVTANKRNIMNQNTKWKKPWNPPGRKMKDQITSDSNTDKNQVQSNSKNVSKNVINKSEWSSGAETTLDNQSVKLQAESYTSYKEFHNANAPVDTVRTVLENTHISSIETVEQTIVDKKTKSTAISNDTSTYDNSSKKQAATNYNHDVNQTIKQHNQHAEKNEIFYPTYPNAPYPPNPRYPGDSEMVNYEMVKSIDMEGTDIPYSDPATVRHFFNLGVKYFWSQNMWANGTNGQPFADNSYYMIQSPHDINLNANMMNGTTVPSGENISQPNATANSNPRHNNRSSPPRHKDQESLNVNGPRQGQKSNYRNSAQRDLHQPSNMDANRNRIEGKSSTHSDQQQQQNSNNKEVQRVNKSNGVAPRFKKNYEGRNRNDHYNMQQQQYQYRQQQQQYQQDYDYRGQNKKGGQSEAQPLPAASQCDINEAAGQMQQQPQQNNHLQHQQQQQQQQPALQPQTPPPQLGNSYPYPIPYNQQMPFIPMAPYPPESEAFPGHYYPPPPGFVSVPYLPAAGDLNGTEPCGGPCAMPPIYPTTMDGFPSGAAAQYPPIYSQYVYHTPIYPGQPPTIPADAAAGYPPYPGQPYFFPYPPPPPPPASTPQNAPPAH